MKRVREKLKKKIGASIAEMLMAVLILLMVTSVVAGGVPVAVHAYQKVVDSANAQMLLSTTVTALRYQLGTASSIKVKGNTLEYHSAITGDTSQLTIGTEGSTHFIQLQEYVGFNKDKNTKDEDRIPPRHLVPVEAGTSHLYLECEFPSDIEELHGGVQFKNIVVKRKADAGGTAELAKLDTLTITSCVNH